jgi:hypothetical protein
MDKWLKGIFPHGVREFLPFMDAGVSLRYQTAVRSLQVGSHASRIVSFSTKPYETSVQVKLARILVRILVLLEHHLIAPFHTISAGQGDFVHHRFYCIVTCC